MRRQRRAAAAAVITQFTLHFFEQVIQGVAVRPCGPRVFQTHGRSALRAAGTTKF